jgi:Pyridine nucleotide-disulphide oxidoreductase
LPRYVSKDDYAEYLAEYAAAHDLDVKLGTRVDRILPAGGHWLVRAGGREFAARAVVVATGKHDRKWLPRRPGFEEFGGGELLHSADYRSGRGFAGRRAQTRGHGVDAQRRRLQRREQGAVRRRRRGHGLHDRAGSAARSPGPPRRTRGLPKVATTHTGLYFIGFRESPRGALYGANRDSRRLAAEVSGYLAG